MTRDYILAALAAQRRDALLEDASAQGIVRRARAAARACTKRAPSRSARDDIVTDGVAVAIEAAGIPATTASR